jgi:hypothetical protein
MDEEYWSDRIRTKRKGKITIRRIRYEPYPPLISDFEIEGHHVGGSKPSFRVRWLEDDGTIVKEYFIEGLEQPTRREELGAGLSSANAGYALVEDWLSDESIWQDEGEEGDASSSGAADGVRS